VSRDPKRGERERRVSELSAKGGQVHGGKEMERKGSFGITGLGGDDLKAIRKEGTVEGKRTVEANRISSATSIGTIGRGS